MAGFDDTLTFNTKIDVSGIENGLKSVQNLGDSIASSVDTTMTKTNSEVTGTVKEISQLLEVLTNDFEDFIAGVNEETISPEVDTNSVKEKLNALQSYATSLAASITSQIAVAITSALSEIPAQIISLGKDFESSMSQVAATMGITVFRVQCVKLCKRLQAILTGLTHLSKTENFHSPWKLFRKAFLMR